MTLFHLQGWKSQENIEKTMEYDKKERGLGPRGPQGPPSRWKSVIRWDQEPWFTGTMVIVTEQKMTKYRTIVSSRMGSDFNEKKNQVQFQKEQGEI